MEAAVRPWLRYLTSLGLRFLLCKKAPPHRYCSTAITHQKPRRVLAASGVPRLSQMHGADTFNLGSEVPGFSDRTAAIPEWPFGADQAFSSSSPLSLPLLHSSSQHLPPTETLSSLHDVCPPPLEWKPCQGRNTAPSSRHCPEWTAHPGTQQVLHASVLNE